jgi:hypothetical protein
VLPSAGEVASLDAGVVAAQAVRVTIRAGADGAAPLFTQARVPFDAPSAAPPPPPPPPPAPMLAALSLPATDWTVGVAVDLAVAGMTAGSALQAVLPPGLTLAAGRIAGTPGDAGAATLVLTETLAGAGNSPRTTTIPITVAAAAVEPDAVLPPHPIGPVDLGTQSAIPLRTMAVEPYMVGARFRRATNTVDFWFRMTEGGDGLIFRIVDDDHYRLIRVIDGVESGIGGHEYLTFAPALVAAPGSAPPSIRTGCRWRRRSTPRSWTRSSPVAGAASALPSRSARRWRTSPQDRWCRRSRSAVRRSIPSRGGSTWRSPMPARPTAMTRRSATAAGHRRARCRRHNPAKRSSASPRWRRASPAR